MYVSDTASLNSCRKSWKYKLLILDVNSKLLRYWNKVQDDIWLVNTEHIQYCWNKDMALGEWAILLVKYSILPDEWDILLDE